MVDMLLSTRDHDTMPRNYVRPENERPGLDHVATDANIPIVDLGADEKSQIISQIAKACRLYGFFQVVNHGIATELIEKAQAIALEFFRLPPEEKAKLYSDDPAKKIPLSTSFNVRKETVHNWRDYLRLHCYPLEEFVPDWPSNPSSFREGATSNGDDVRSRRLLISLGFSAMALCTAQLLPGGASPRAGLLFAYYAAWLLAVVAVLVAVAFRRLPRAVTDVVDRALTVRAAPFPLLAFCTAHLLRALGEAPVDSSAAAARLVGAYAAWLLALVAALAPVAGVAPRAVPSPILMLLSAIIWYLL